MAVIQDADIRLALRKVAKTAAAWPAATHCSYENQDFEKPDPPALFVEETLFPVDERIIATGCIQADGYVQYNIWLPKNGGTKPADTLRAQLKALFQPASSIQSATPNIDIQIVRSYPVPVLYDEQWALYPFHVVYRCFAFK